MRMRKANEKVPTLEDLVQKFLLVKQSQHTGELAMRDYRDNGSNTSNLYFVQ